MRFAAFIPFLLAACSFAEGASMPVDDDVALHVQPHELDQFEAVQSFGLEDDIEPGSEPLFADAHSSCVQAQLDAEAMLADVRAAHDDEAALVLRERERR